MGGTAALSVETPTESALLVVAAALAAIDGTAPPVLVLGKGSNLLVADAGFDGLVLSLGSGFDVLAIEEGRVRAGGAVSLPVLARRTAAAGWRGLEWAVGVPGSVGGAVRMNAGGHGSDTAATLVSCRVVDLATGSVRVVPAAEMELAYRTSRIGPTEVVTEAVHVLERGDAGQAKELIDEVVRWRRANQPGGSNAGSVFTNPPGDSAGRLVDACGLKGARIGTAEVSHKHANFIQADPGGSADDVRRLIAHVRGVVATETGIDLRPEVRFVGFPRSDTGPGAGGPEERDR